MFVHVLSAKGKTLFERDLPAEPDAFLDAVKPFRKNLVVGCECMFAWYWLADLCEADTPTDLGISPPICHRRFKKMQTQLRLSRRRVWRIRCAEGGCLSVCATNRRKLLGAKGFVAEDSLHATFRHLHPERNATLAVGAGTEAVCKTRTRHASHLVSACPCISPNAMSVSVTIPSVFHVEHSLDLPLPLVHRQNLRPCRVRTATLQRPGRLERRRAATDLRHQHHRAEHRHHVRVASQDRRRWTDRPHHRQTRISAPRLKRPGGPIVRLFEC